MRINDARRRVEPRIADPGDAYLPIVVLDRFQKEFDGVVRVCRFVRRLWVGLLRLGQRRTHLAEYAFALVAAAHVSAGEDVSTLQ